MSLELEREAAEEAASDAAEQLRGLQRTLASDRDIDTSAVVTEAEYAAEEVITEALDDPEFDHGIVFEEDRVRESDGEGTWLVDPLDGTDSFRDGDDEYAVSIALYQSKVPKVGVVAAPAREQLFTAVEGDPPECKRLVPDGEGGLVAGDSKELEQDWKDDVADATLVSGYDRGGQFLRSFAGEAGGLRRCSSAALNLCDLARGEVDGHWEFDTYPWDVAGGLVVARAADATVTNPLEEGFQPGLEPDTEQLPLLASGKEIHGNLQETAAEVLEQDREARSGSE